MKGLVEALAKLHQGWEDKLAAAVALGRQEVAEAEAYADEAVEEMEAEMEGVDNLKAWALRQLPGTEAEARAGLAHIMEGREP